MSDAVSPPDLAPPDIAFLRTGNTGVDYVTTLDSGVPGPHLVVNGLVHGNEVCGAIAIVRLARLGIRPLRGKLTLALANVEAFRRYDPSQPLAARCVDEDFNRVWSDRILDGPGDSVERRRARALRPIYRQADAVLDLHSMTSGREPLLLCGRTARARRLARDLGFPRWVIADSGHAAGPRLLEYGDYAAPDDTEGVNGGKVALLAECGQHEDPTSAQVALTLCALFLRRFGLIAEETAAALAPSPHAAASQIVVEVAEAVTAASDGFVMARDFANMEILPAAGTLIGHEQGRPVRTPHDDCVLIMPARKARRGQTVVRLGRMAAA